MWLDDEEINYTEVFSFNGCIVLKYNKSCCYVIFCGKKCLRDMQKVTVAL